MQNLRIHKYFPGEPIFLTSAIVLCILLRKRSWKGERHKGEKDHSISILFSFLKSILFGQTVIAVSNDTNLKGNTRRLQTGLWAYQQEYVATNCWVNETACCFLSLSLWVLCQSIWGGARAPGGVKDTCWGLIGAHCC